MKRAQAIGLAALGAAALVILWLAMSNRQPPLLPADRAHAEFAGPEGCLTCHGPGKSRPRPPSHPVANDCMRCHGRR